MQTCNGGHGGSAGNRANSGTGLRLIFALHYCLLLAREGEDARILLSGLETAGLFRYVDRQRIAFQLEDSSLVLSLKNFIPGSIDSGDQFSRRTISGPPATGSENPPTRDLESRRPVSKSETRRM
jgi:hypothetical protein